MPDFVLSTSKKTVERTKTRISVLSAHHMTHGMVQFPSFFANDMKLIH